MISIPLIEIERLVFEGFNIWASCIIFFFFGGHENSFHTRWKMIEWQSMCLWTKYMSPLWGRTPVFPALTISWSVEPCICMETLIFISFFVILSLFAWEHLTIFVTASLQSQREIVSTNHLTSIMPRFWCPMRKSASCDLILSIGDHLYCVKWAKSTRMDESQGHYFVFRSNIWFVFHTFFTIYCVHDIATS